MTRDDVIDSMSLGKAHDLLCRMAYRDVDISFEGLVGVLGLHRAQNIVVVLARLLNHGFRLNHTAELWWSHDGRYVH
jgi:hypothetical protein